MVYRKKRYVKRSSYKRKKKFTKKRKYSRRRLMAIPRGLPPTMQQKHNMYLEFTRADLVSEGLPGLQASNVANLYSLRVNDPSFPVPQSMGGIMYPTPYMTNRCSGVDQFYTFYNMATVTAFKVKAYVVNDTDTAATTAANVNFGQSYPIYVSGQLGIRGATPVAPDDKDRRRQLRENGCYLNLIYGDGIPGSQNSCWLKTYGNVKTILGHGADAAQMLKDGDTVPDNNVIYFHLHTFIVDEMRDLPTTTTVAALAEIKIRIKLTQYITWKKGYRQRITS